MTMKGHILILVGSLAVSLALAGCSPNALTGQAAGTRAFDSAEPEIKALWGAVVSGLKTNDYVGPQAALWDLRAATNLTAQQRAAVDHTLKTVSSQMFNAASRGDPKALKAMEDLRQIRTEGRTR
jgi:hypothetical protein